MHILIDGEDGYNGGSIPTGQVARPALSTAAYMAKQAKKEMKTNTSK